MAKIERKTGNIVAGEAEALVNTVNCAGVMGSGISLDFKKAFPENFKAYADACERGEVRPGRMFVYKREIGHEQPRCIPYPDYIINFPTKRHWRNKSRMADIEVGLGALAREIENRDIRSIAVPPLGCGLGGLDWGEVRPRIEDALGKIDGLRIVLFEPVGSSKGGKASFYGPP